jgi:oxygen-independent coproporphyrinogen III oxidase
MPPEPACSISEGPRAAYVHVPFCVHRCGYCDFTVITGRDDLLGTYLDCLETELRLTLSEPRPVRTLFVGGGTPSYLPAGHLQRLLGILAFWLPLERSSERQSVTEFSVECNPERLTPDRMDLLAEAGVDRISLGVQSFDARHLRTLERSHSPEEVSRVVEALRERGVGNISFDLIFAVPGQSLEDWERTLQDAADLTPEHLSTYGLTYEKGTRFWTRRSKSDLIPAAEELEREMYDLAMTLLPERGYEQYELSNFARPGFACRHNQVYWEGEDYYGFGPGAAGCIAGVRTMNHRSTTTWIKRIEAARQPKANSQQPTATSTLHAERETLTPDLRAREAVMLGLRMLRGIDLRRFEERFGTPVRSLAPEAYDRFLESGLLAEQEGTLRLTYAGRFLADTVVTEFL